MAKYDNPLNNLRIASPCSQDWEAMVGDNLRRYCGECKLNVYNLSGMSKTEAENLIQMSEGRLCVRYFQRADGSVITEDCPVGWARIKNRTKVLVTAAASLVFSLFGAVGLQFAVGRQEVLDATEPVADYCLPPTPEVMGTPAPPLMGNVAVPSSTPKQQPTPKATPKVTPRILMGKPMPPKKETMQRVLMGDIDMTKNS